MLLRPCPCGDRPSGTAARRVAVMTDGPVLVLQGGPAQGRCPWRTGNSARATAASHASRVRVGQAAPRSRGWTNAPGSPIHGPRHPVPRSRRTGKSGRTAAWVCRAAVRPRYLGTPALRRGGADPEGPAPPLRLPRPSRACRMWRARRPRRPGQAVLPGRHRRMSDTSRRTATDPAGTGYGTATDRRTSCSPRRTRPSPPCPDSAQPASRPSPGRSTCWRQERADHRNPP